jgi:hypothetical protein
VSGSGARVRSRDWSKGLPRMMISVDNGVELAANAGVLTWSDTYSTAGAEYRDRNRSDTSCRISMMDNNPPLSRVRNKCNL